MSENIKSSVTVAVKSRDRILLIKSGENEWKLPLAEFDGNINGSLKDTVKRLLDKHVEGGGDVDFLGSFLRRYGESVKLGYNFLVKGDFDILSKSYKWVNLTEISDISLDENSALFLRLHQDVL